MKHTDNELLDAICWGVAMCVAILIYIASYITLKLK